MKIGIDASRALKPQRTGTEVHNAEIIKHLVAIDDKNNYILYSNKAPSGDMAELKSERITWRIMPFSRGWTLFRLSWEMLFNPPDILFVPAHILPLITPKKSVVMIHDLGFEHFPELYKWTDKAYHRYAARFARRHAAQILTPSEFTRQDLHEKYHVPLERITVVYHGFDPHDFHAAPKDEKSPLDVPYFYFVGRLEYKKNIIRMMQAFAEFKQKTGLSHKFVLAGRPAFGWDEIEAARQKLSDIADEIIFLGFVAQDEATKYLRHAEALVFATLFEGFGIPVLEAFASGTPVICSNTTSLPEIAGDATLLVNPTRTQEIASAMSEIAINPKVRQELIEKGSQRYKKFSWDNAARKTLDVLEKAAG